VIRCQNDLKYRVPINERTLYYPSKLLNDNSYSDSAINSMYSEILFNLHEPILYDYRGDCILFRLLWLRPFDEPVAISVYQSKKYVAASVKKLGKNFFKEDSFSYKIDVDTMLSIEYKKWKDITSKLSLEQEKNTSINWDQLYNIKDATLWVLEINNKGDYYVKTNVYTDSSSLNNFGYAKALYLIGNNIIKMKSSRAE
jgi:hypothetical protein